MFTADGVTYTFHHLGLPTGEARPGERYSRAYGMYTCDDPCRLIHVQWHRYDPDSPLHPLLRERPHPAFKVSDLGRAIAGKTVLLGPYEPIPGYRVAAVEDGGIAIELIETTLRDEEIWGRAAHGALYREDPEARRETARGLGVNAPARRSTLRWTGGRRLRSPRVPRSAWAWPVRGPLRPPAGTPSGEPSSRQ